MDRKITAEEMTVWTNTEFAVDNDTIWFVPHECCFLLQYDYIKKKIKQKIFLEGSTSLWSSHYCVLKVEQYIVLVPGKNNNIYVYDTNNRVMRRIELKKGEGVRDYFRKYAIWNKEIFFFPIEYQNIVTINLVDFSVEEIPILKQQDNIYSLSMNITNSLQRGKLVDLCIAGSNVVFRFNLETYEGKFFLLEDSEEYRVICSFGENNVLLIGKERKAFVYDGNYNKIQEFNLPENHLGYVDCVEYKNGYILVPNKKKDSIFYWTKNVFNRIKNIDALDDKANESLWKYNDYSQLKIIAEKALFFDVPKQLLCVLDMNSLEVEYQKVEISVLEKDDKVNLFSLAKSENHLSESNFWNLRFYIKLIVGDQ